MQQNLQSAFGNIDIYLFDQLLKGRFDHCKSVLDVGCGTGRNLVYFYKNDFQVFAIDRSAEAIMHVKKLAQNLAPALSTNNFKVCGAEELPFENNQFDVVISSAVFHFAEDEFHFEKMVNESWRVLAPGGFLFARLASDIGIEHAVIPLGNKRYKLPDGSERFLVNEKMLLDYSKKLDGELYEPIKTTNVQNLRCMTTWAISKKY